MKNKHVLQIALGFVIATALVVFFINSQIDRTVHEKTITQLLKLLELDERSNVQVGRLQAGLDQNYAELADNIRVIRTLYKTLPEQPNNNKSLSEELNKQFNHKFKLIESFKKDHAVLKYTSRYIPQLIRDTRDLMNNINGLSTAQKNSIDKTLVNLTPEINLFIAGQVDNKKSIFAKLKTLKSIHFASTNLTQEVAMRDLIKQIETLATKKISVENLVGKIVNIPTDKIIKKLYQSHKKHFSVLENTAEMYQQWLFITALALLFYLPYIYIQLKAVSSNLKETLVDLDFHKNAIDKHAIVFITNHKGIITSVNDKFVEISQYSKKELIGSSLSILKSGQQSSSYFANIWKTIISGKTWHGEIASRAKNGDIFWANASITPHLNASGKPFQFTTIETVISNAKPTSEKAKMLASFPEKNPDPILRVDDHGLIIYGNTASKALLKNWGTAINQSLPHDWVVICSRAIKLGKNETHGINIGEKHYSIVVVPLQSESCINLYAYDQTEQKISDENLSYQATHDLLTGLNNRLAFELKLESDLVNARHNNTEHVLLYIDLDQFKVVNDICGHVAGDELLRQLPKILSALLRDSDTLARLGGDEFGVLLTNCGIDKGIVIANKICTAVKNFRFSWENSSFEIGASIGAVLINQDSENIDKILKHADLACYAAKDEGRNQVQIYHDEPEKTEQRKDELQWTSEIPKALAENRFVLMGQVIVPLHPENDTDVFYEVLIRLENNEGTLIPPGAFIPAAERHGFMASIDYWVVSNTFETLTKHAVDNPDIPLKVVINLSTDSLGSNDLLSYISSQIKLGKIPMGSVSFAITETSAITNLSTAVDFIKELKALGCQFVLGGFGSGLSSFTYLKNLSVDYLKIDGALVKDVLDNPIDEAMLIAINHIGHVMDIKTIGDFVEDKDIEKRLKNIGVDYAQGYGIKYPQRLTDIITQLVCSNDSSTAHIKTA